MSNDDRSPGHILAVILVERKILNVCSRESSLLERLHPGSFKPISNYRYASTRRPNVLLPWRLTLFYSHTEAGLLDTGYCRRLVVGCYMTDRLLISFIINEEFLVILSFYNWSIGLISDQIDKKTAENIEPLKKRKCRKSNEGHLRKGWE